MNSQHATRDGSFIKAHGWIVPAVLLLAAFVLRALYAWQLPLNIDEQSHLVLAREISLHPDHFNLPLGSGVTNHPLLAVYLAALFDWVGGGSIYFIRLMFSAISLLGLAGLFVLTGRMFGRTAGLMALFLGAADHHLISKSVLMLEPVYLCLVPWTLLAFYRALAGRRGDWLLVGLLFGLGYFISEVFLLLVLPLTLYAVVTRRMVRLLKTPQLYVGVGIFVLLAAPHVLWNLAHQAPNLVRHADRIGHLGLTPRALLLYLGDLMICGLDWEWVLLEVGHAMYAPIEIPAHWVAGLIYLGAMVWALRWWRRPQAGLMLMVAVVVGVFVSMLNTSEPWNEIGWASLTLFPVLALTGRAGRALARRNVGRWVVLAAGVVIAVLGVRFVTGLKYGYASPCPEKALLGRILNYSHHAKSTSPELVRFPYGRITNHQQKMLLEAERALAENPDSLLAAYIIWYYSPDEVRATEMIQKILDEEPSNPAMLLSAVTEMHGSRNWFLMAKCLEKALAAGHRYQKLLKVMADVQYEMGNYQEARRYAAEALRKKPDETELYLLQFKIGLRLGNFQEAERMIDRFIPASPDPTGNYLIAALESHDLGAEDLAKRLYQKAHMWGEELPETPNWEWVHQWVQQRVIEKRPGRAKLLGLSEEP